MHSSTGMSARVVLCLMVAAVVLSVVTRGTQANSVMPLARCNPNMMYSLPPRLQRTCNSLFGIDETFSAIENSSNEKSIHQDKYPAEGDHEVKLQHVDHIFFRFGRR